ncbi:MAG: OB-fold nucleic acid binding domain-containing protein [Nanoarchaeota archaeon]
MIRLSYDEIVARIKEKAGISDGELAAKVDSKMAQLAGLVSKEGAAHIVASELGIKLVDQLSGRLQIKNILTGMRDVETVGKVLQVFEQRTFSSGNREGKLASLQLADETGSIRAVLWNEQADNVKGINVADVVKVKSAYVRERNGLKELHLNDRSAIIVNPPGETVNVEITPTATSQQRQQKAVRKKLSELNETDAMAEVLGTIVQAFDIKFFEVCPECGKRARQSQADSKFICNDHSTINPSYSYVMNTVIDDGTETMRLVLFRRMVERLLNKTEQEVLAYRSQPDSFQQVKNDILGSFVKAVVRVNKNELFDRLELIAQEISEASPDEEIARLNDELAAVEKGKLQPQNLNAQ